MEKERTEVEAIYVDEVAAIGLRIGIVSIMIPLPLNSKNGQWLRLSTGQQPNI